MSSLAHSHHLLCCCSPCLHFLPVRFRLEQYGQTALVFASFSGYQDVVEILLRYQAQPDIQTKVRGAGTGETDCGCWGETRKRPRDYEYAATESGCCSLFRVRLLVA